MKQATITLVRLYDVGACKKQCDKFQALFGESVTFRSKRKFIAACIEHASTFDFSWAAGVFLNTAACVEYARVTRSAFAAYHHATVQRSTLPERIAASLSAALDGARVAAFLAYERVRAIAFAEAYWNQENPT